MPYGSKTPKQFENDLDHLLKHLKPISLDTLYDCVVNKKAIPENSFIVTFDDGLRQVYENAMPILLRKGVPAIFFINTSVIDNQDLLFRYKSSLIVEQVLSFQKSGKSLDAAMAVLKQNNAIFDGNIVFLDVAYCTASAVPLGINRPASIVANLYANSNDLFCRSFHSFGTIIESLLRHISVVWLNSWSSG
jgi:hypothetical protein